MTEDRNQGPETAGSKPERLPQWHSLDSAAAEIDRPENHLRHLLEEEGRARRYAIGGGGLLYDYSRQRVNRKVVDRLSDLARARSIRDRFGAMARGERVNATEGRAALHTACRDFSGKPLVVDGLDVTARMAEIRERIKTFSEKVRNGVIRGSTGKPFRHVVVIGIGGSYLGTAFVSQALEAYARGGMTLHYLANVDIHNFGGIAARIDPEATLWIVISKSYTTAETLANAGLAYEFMRGKGVDPAGHVVTVTAQGSPGDDPENPVLDTFHMFGFIGGRYSVTSAVGGVPLSLYLGYDHFERFLKGAEEMDRHALSAEEEQNAPLMAAMIGIWNNNFLGYPALGIIPYADPLAKLAPHVQQLYMESNGKSVSIDGEPLDIGTGVIVFGEPGTNAQHSFFQLAHQGRPFPIEFIGVINPQYQGYTATSKGVTNHQELWANLISQPMALALGGAGNDPARSFSGNRPSSTILLEDLSPESVGRLLSFYEARTVYEAFVWGINPFDQFGVELGKSLATDIRKQMAEKNRDPDHPFGGTDPIRRFYLETLFSGTLTQP